MSLSNIGVTNGVTLHKTATTPTLSINAAGELLFSGGYARRSPHNDLYVFSMRDLSVTFPQTSGEVPNPHLLAAGDVKTDFS